MSHMPASSVTASLTPPPVYTSPKRKTLPLTTEPRSLRFAEADPDKKSVHTINIVNTGTSRMAWRVLSNNSRNYLVNPNKGFVGVKELVRVEVTLLNTARYSKRDKLMVQMKTAGDGEVDREEVWKRADQRNLSNLRVLTSISPKEKKSLDNPHLSPNSLSPSPAAQTKSTESDSTTTAASPADPQTHGEFLAEILNLEGEIQKALEEKSQRTRDLTQIVNDVKMLEQELDKETNRLFSVSRQYEHLLHDVVTLKKKKEEEQQPVQSGPQQ